MKDLYMLTKRNCIVFLRDRSAVFFSLLSMLIILGLTGIFLGGMNVDQVVQILKTYGGTRNTMLDQFHAEGIMIYWTLAGVLMVNSLTVTMSVLGAVISDRDSFRLQAFCVTPTHRLKIALSYVFSSIFVSFLFGVITMLVSAFILERKGIEQLPPTAFGIILALVLLNTTIYAIILYLVSMFVKSGHAWSSLATVIGTLSGFLGAIYVPVGNLPNSILGIVKVLPMLQGASLLRQVCCRDIIKTTFEGISPEVMDSFENYMGITIHTNGIVLNSNFQVLFLLMYGILAIVCITIFMKYMKITEK